MRKWTLMEWQFWWPFPWHLTWHETHFDPETSVNYKTIIIGPLQMRWWKYEQG